MADLSAVRKKAWETRRAKYGPMGHASSYSRRSDFMAALKDAQDAMRPFFGERRRIRDENAPAIRKALTDMDVTVDTIGGNCPVQAEGSVDGQRFYFRARGEHWSLEIGPEETWHGHGAWYYEEEYGSWPDAGWMHEHEALAFIAQGVKLYRANPPSPLGHIKPDGANRGADANATRNGRHDAAVPNGD